MIRSDRVRFALSAAVVLAALLAGRPLLGLFLLWLPGWALDRGFQLSRHAGAGERVLIRVALSLCVVLLGGLLMGVLGYPLDAAAWAVWLAGAAGLGLARAVQREGVQALVSVFRLPDIALNRTTLIGVTAGGLALFAVWLGVAAAQTQPQPDIVQFWLVERALTGESIVVEVGVVHAVPTEQAYALQVLLNDQVVLLEPRVTLRPGERYTSAIDLPLQGLADTEWRAELYRADDLSQPFRHARLYINVLEQNS